MRRCIYWVAECEDDSSVYSLRARTRRECVALRDATTGRYCKVHKVTVEYFDAFDLVRQCMGEGRINETAVRD